MPSPPPQTVHIMVKGSRLCVCSLPLFLKERPLVNPEKQPSPSVTPPNFKTTHMEVGKRRGPACLAYCHVGTTMASHSLRRHILDTSHFYPIVSVEDLKRGAVCGGCKFGLKREKSRRQKYNQEVWQGGSVLLRTSLPQVSGIITKGHTDFVAFASLNRAEDSGDLMCPTSPAETSIFPSSLLNNGCPTILSLPVDGTGETCLHCQGSGE